ncbi:polysaccharide pyruvyl transferase family protein [Microbacterium sp.]|uniref:polysaccharide pyruvyl transferase family protein n=1 Tax=Microbacterium sp. TaxID=51671 RepID=UPI00281205B1|nr:polysaccharide pyruvyl transferase family protein [Microbacterium sp.]
MPGIIDRIKALVSRRAEAPTSVTPAPATGAPRKPVLGLAGFFGAGNYGDELFLEVFEQYFGDEFELRVLADKTSQPYYSRPVAEIVNEVDAILIGGGDILQPWGRDPRYFNPAFLKKPCFVVGIGVPQYRNAKPARPEVIERHKAFFRNANLKRIGVRDDQAAKWIREHLEPELPVLVAPDIVCTLDLPDAPKPAGAPILGVVTRFRPNREVPDDYTQVKRLAETAQQQGWRIRHLILGTAEVGRRDASNAADLDVPGKEVFYSEDLQEITRAIGECSAFASMKFHGSVVATMYGIPSVVMIATNKNVNFMKRIGLSALLSQFDAPDLTEKWLNRPEVDLADVKRIRAESDAHMRELVAEVKATVGQTTAA